METAYIIYCFGVIFSFCFFVGLDTELTKHITFKELMKDACCAIVWPITLGLFIGAVCGMKD